MTPAQKGLGARQQAPIQLRLIEESKLIVADCLAEISFQGHSGIYRGLKGWSEEEHRIAPRRFGLVHRDVGLL